MGYCLPIKDRKIDYNFEFCPTNLSKSKCSCGLLVLISFLFCYLEVSFSSFTDIRNGNNVS